MQFNPPKMLRSAHTQTVLASRLTQRQHLTSAAYEAAAQRLTLTSSDNVSLEAWVNVQQDNAPLAVLLHGWLGCAQSTYVRRTADYLQQRGYNVARLNFRDHGGTSHLNQPLFHSARLTEVLDACNSLVETYGQTNQTVGIIGFSLGGNFTLRLAASQRLDPKVDQAIAICPAVNPTTAAIAIDAGWFGYRWYFVRRWHKALAEKAAAFPALYDFSAATGMGTVSELTDYFVREYTPYDNAQDYYQAYEVTQAMLAQASCSVSILAARDDPVIPIGDLRRLGQLNSINYVETEHGGHCAFVDSWSGGSPVGPWLHEQLNASASSSNLSH